MRHWVWVLISFSLSLVLWACTPAAGDLKIEKAWARPGLKGETSAVYFTLTNSREEEDRLTGAGCEVAEAAELHLSMMDMSGTMKMVPQEFVPIPPGQTVEFKPGGLHVMLINLKQELKPGDQFDLTLTFEKTGKKTLPITVQQP